MANKTFGGVMGALLRPIKARQPSEGSAAKPWGRGSANPAGGDGQFVPWYLPTETPYWTWDRYQGGGNNQGTAVYNPVPPKTVGPLGTPVPYTDPARFDRVGNGYPGILPCQAYDAELQDGPRPESYRRFQAVRLMDTTPNRIGGGTSGGNDNQIVMWSLAGQLYGRPPQQVMSQPAHNQRQGVGAVPSIYARRTVG